jgi:hypothetical protein
MTAALLILPQHRTKLPDVHRLDNKHQRVDIVLVFASFPPLPRLKTR